MQKVIKKLTREESERENKIFWLSVDPNEKLSILQEIREQYIELFNKKELYNESRKRLLRMDGFPEEFLKLLNEFNVKYLILLRQSKKLYSVYL